MNTGISSSNQRRPSRGSMNNLRTIIHTGWWGCGAYGNNRQMMLITQILAAQWAQIDRIIFHTQNKEHEKDIEQAEQAVEKLRLGKRVKEVVDEIFHLNLEWEKSNNT
jgi:Spy/CpxP family protein refolding chaperone